MYELKITRHFPRKPSSLPPRWPACQSGKRSRLFWLKAISPPCAKRCPFCGTHLIHPTVICVVPQLCDGVADVGGVVSTHGETWVHHHRVQSVAAANLEPQTNYVLLSWEFWKNTNLFWAKLRVDDITGAKSGAKASPASWEKSKFSGKATSQSSFRVPTRLLRNLLRFRHRMLGSDVSRKPWRDTDMLMMTAFDWMSCRSVQAEPGPHLLRRSLCLALGAKTAVGTTQLLVLEEWCQAVLLDGITEGNSGQFQTPHLVPDY